MSADTQARSSGMEIAKGIASCFALNLLHLGIAWLFLVPARAWDFFASVTVVLIAGFGVLQLVYVVPLVLNARKKGRPNFAKGMIIGASIALLLNAACWGSFYWS